MSEEQKKIKIEQLYNKINDIHKKLFNDIHNYLLIIKNYKQELNNLIKNYKLFESDLVLNPEINDLKNNI